MVWTRCSSHDFHCEKEVGNGKRGKWDVSLWSYPLAEDNNREIIFALRFSSIVPIFKLLQDSKLLDVLLGMLSRRMNTFDGIIHGGLMVNICE